MDRLLKTHSLELSQRAQIYIFIPTFDHHGVLLFVKEAGAIFELHLEGEGGGGGDGEDGGLSEPPHVAGGVTGTRLVRETPGTARASQEAERTRETGNRRELGPQ